MSGQYYRKQQKIPSPETVKRSFTPYSIYFFSDLAFFPFLRKISERNRITFIATKNTTKIIHVIIGFCGARVANSIMGKPNTMAGKV